MSIYASKFGFAAVLGCCAMLSALAHAAPESPVTTPAKVGNTTLADSDLSANPVLKTAITVEAKAQPLTEFLAAVSAQQNVTLKVAPQVLDKALVTVHLENYALSQLMSSLQRLYNTRWSRVSEREYVLDTPMGTELDATLGRLGDLGWWDTRQRKAQVEESAVQWKPQVLQAYDQRDLQQVGGVSLREMPEEIQQGVRRRIELRSRNSLVHRLAEARIAAVEEIPIEIRPRLARDGKTVIDFQLMVNDQRGAWSLPILQLATEQKAVLRDAATGGR